MNKKPTVFVIGGEVKEVPLTEDASNFPKIGRKFLPATHPNDRVKVAISKRTQQNKKVTKIYHSLADLKELVKA